MAALTDKLSGPKFETMLEELRALSAKPTLEQIADVMVRYGVTSPKAKDGKPSKMAATTLRDGPFKRYLERLNAGRETREALCAAAGAGVHPLDAIEEAITLELQDHLVGAEGGEVDIKFVIGQVEKLRSSISMRENSRRQQADLERKQSETEKKLEVADQQIALRDEQIAKLKLERQENERKFAQIAAQVDRAANAPAASADEVRAAAVAEIDRIMGLKK